MHPGRRRPKSRMGHINKAYKLITIKKIHRKFKVYLKGLITTLQEEGNNGN
jgi:hypothetical protein